MQVLALCSRRAPFRSRIATIGSVRRLVVWALLNCDVLDDGVVVVNTLLLQAQRLVGSDGIYTTSGSTVSRVWWDLLNIRLDGLVGSGGIYTMSGSTVSRVCCINGPFVLRRDRRN